MNKQSSDVIINEFLAANGTGLTDEDGDYSDWIEIHNRTNRPVNLAGWALTDDPNQPDKWTFPDITLDRQGYLVVFASGKDRKTVEPGSKLHTNFGLSKTGDFLALYNTFERRFMDEISPQFPKQVKDVSYGRYGDQVVFGFFSTPTPGGPNEQTNEWTDAVARVEFSVERGFYDEPFNLELHTATPGATIRYTTDGSEPTETHGATYTQPLTIETTTLVRATAFKPGYRPSYVDTHSYIFLDAVLTQPAQPPGFPPDWGTHVIDFAGYTAGSPVIADYEMDPEVVNDPRYSGRLKDALKSIPSISLVMDQKSFYDLYSNPRERGVTWERPASVELIDPTGRQQGFQINAGLRIQGGVGRWEYMPKHSFRLFFKEQYGATKLEYPIFPNSPVERFDTLILRGGVNRSYAGRPREQGSVNHEEAVYTRDEWLRASQIAISGVGSHGTFVHLYLNGLYWGLYNLVERPDASFTSAYFGGNKEDWFAAQHGVTITATGELPGASISGSRERFDTLHRLARNGGLEDPAKYELIKTYLDTTEFIDYVILNWYAGNIDWTNNNWYVGVQGPTGQVKYFAWDAENTWDKGARIYWGNADVPGRPNLTKPLFEALIKNSDFKMELADRLYKHLFNNGPLTDANAQARWMKITHIIDRAILGESARWGDARYDRPITRDDWLKARDDVLGQMEGNAARLIALAREAGYYPDIDPRPLINKAA